MEGVTVGHRGYGGHTGRAPEGYALAMSTGALGAIFGRGEWLIAVSVAKEASAVARGVGGNAEGLGHWTPSRIAEGVDLLVTGVGKSNAAGAVAYALAGRSYTGVLNLGVCGALPADEGGEGSAGLGDVVLARESIFADEGLITPEGYVDVSRMGFPPDSGLTPSGAMGVKVDDRLREAIGARCTWCEPIATVSLCSGTDEHAREVRRRSGALCEAMEGAAIGLAVRRAGRAGAAFGEIRVVSNTAGDRTCQRWDLAGALERLAEVSWGMLGKG